ncbi:MAG: sigma-54 dependent transcriptional regulator, partial [Planctomycetaceae bacterium]
ELDRLFFSLKYQLGAALRGVHAAVEHLTDEGDLGHRVVDSCREVLEVSRAAVYRRSEAGTTSYRLSASIGEDFPEMLNLDPMLLNSLADGGSVQRVLAGSRGDVSPVQVLLRRLAAQLLYVPSTGGGLSTLLVLGPKPNDASFTAEDLTFLSALGHVADVALDGVGAQRLHRQMTDELGRAEETLAGQLRQIAVLQAELAEFHRRQGTGAATATEDEFQREIIRGDSPAINSVLETVRKVAGSDATVMIRGESGTGKELLAQVIHDNSPRRAQPLVRVHCAALSPALLESELFGHVKGAFTGADKDKIGRFQMADGGTLFLDEIGEISPEVQVKLLRVLQERCFEPVGSSKTVHVDVRLITATNRNLEEMISSAEFREDLYYRLNVITVTLPPLRERVGDVYDLAFTFLHRAAHRLGKSVVRFDDAVLSVMTRYNWPGNIRELQNVVERAVVLADGETISLDDLPAELTPLRSSGTPSRRLPAPATESGRGRPSTRPKPVGRVRTVAIPQSDLSERERLVAALRDSDGNKAEAARLLGLPRSTFFSKLKKYDLK